MFTILQVNRIIINDEPAGIKESTITVKYTTTDSTEPIDIPSASIKNDGSDQVVIDFNTVEEITGVVITFYTIKETTVHVEVLVCAKESKNIFYQVPMYLYI